MSKKKKEEEVAAKNEKKLCARCQGMRIALLASKRTSTETEPNETMGGAGKERYDARIEVLPIK